MKYGRKKHTFLILTTAIVLAALAIQFAMGNLDVTVAFFEVAFAIVVAAIQVWYS